MEFYCYQNWQARYRYLYITFASKIYWTDSTITLAWIKDYLNRWKTFVANCRVLEIHIASRNEERHVPSEENPVDLLSRGI